MNGHKLYRSTGTLARTDKPVFVFQTRPLLGRLDEAGNVELVHWLDEPERSVIS